MASFSWLIRRLKAMSIPEVIWRFSQRDIQRQEEKQFGEKRSEVIDEVFNKKYSFLQIHPDRLHINFDNNDYTLNSEIHLLAGAEYKQFKKIWNAGFQTENKWPDTFSYKLEYKQRDEIGDARTNWELNRHFQFALLAKDYAASGDSKYLEEFEELFNDWNLNNPFLQGICWTSVMEVAIRCSNWCYAYAFLYHRGAPDELLKKLCIGIINMTDYIVRHYSRYSSANNHLIVEAYAIGQSGILFAHQEWIDLSLRLLTRELPLQNYNDGINKELSLHYQSFYMEAMGLMMRLLKKNEITVPSTWEPMLQKMCRYLAACIGKYGETVVFGDDDEGKILDLYGGEQNHYRYVLNLLGIMLSEKYTDGNPDENLRWLYDTTETDRLKTKETYIPNRNSIFKEGGNSILRSQDNEVLIGIDHAALGFGSIAAHGHADALSFQLFYKGNPVFVDPGTYIYHCDLNSRNDFRRTKDHNTVSIDDKDQSEMLGAFLWGKKAKVELLSCEQDKEKIKLTMEHDGYAPKIHRRIFEFDGDRQILIRDQLSQQAKADAYYIFAPDISISIENQKAFIFQNDVIIASMIWKDGRIQEINREYSNQYGLKRPTKGIKVSFVDEINLEISLL